MGETRFSSLYIALNVCFLIELFIKVLYNIQQIIKIKIFLYIYKIIYMYMKYKEKR